MIKHVLYLAFLLQVFAFPAHAQAPGDTARLLNVLRGIRPRVTLRAHSMKLGTFEGPFISADSALVIGHSWDPKRIPLAELDTLRLRSGSGARVGALVGGGIGGLVAGVVLAAFCSDPDNSCGARTVVPSVLLGGLVGALAGSLIGLGISGSGKWFVAFP